MELYRQELQFARRTFECRRQRCWRTKPGDVVNINTVLAVLTVVHAEWVTKMM